MPDAIFAHDRLAAVYDAFEPSRPDLDVYEAMVDELGARSVLDVGCGTGTFAARLAARGIEVTGVDPAAASLAVARRKSGPVRWIHGDATTLPPLQVDLAFMTGNVAQVFLTDADWLATLRGIWAALRPGGRLVFETRDPAARAWEAWDGRQEQVGGITRRLELTEVRPPLVSFRYTYIFPDGFLTSESTLRFRSREEITKSLQAAGFTLAEVRDAPDRPGLEWVFVARRQGATMYPS